MRKFPKLKRGDVVLIDWDDTHTSQRWENDVDLIKHSPVGCQSVGWYVGRNPSKEVVISSMHDKQNCMNMNTFLPSAMIRKIKKVKV